MGKVGRSRVCALLIFALAQVSCDPSSRQEAGLRTHERLNPLLWVRSAAEYGAVAEQIYALATLRLDQALQPGNEDWTAALEQEGDYRNLPPAVILDVDEAILDTSEFQVELVYSGRAFDRDTWNAWVRRASAPAIPGALEFTRYAESRGVDVFYVTNRLAEVEADTLRNLLALGFPVEESGENLLTKSEQEDWTSDKTSRRDVVARGHRVILIVGDDLNDFVLGSRVDPLARIERAQKYHAYWGSKWILLPNQMYGTWERALYGFDETLPRAEILKRKWEALSQLP